MVLPGCSSKQLTVAMELITNGSGAAAPGAARCPILNGAAGNSQSPQYLEHRARRSCRREAAAAASRRSIATAAAAILDGAQLERHDGQSDRNTVRRSIRRRRASARQSIGGQRQQQAPLERPERLGGCATSRIHLDGLPSTRGRRRGGCSTAAAAGISVSHAGDQSLDPECLHGVLFTIPYGSLQAAGHLCSGP
jgi:hypothetical protein